MTKGSKVHSLLLVVLSIFCFWSSPVRANCKNPDFLKKITETAKEEGVVENELLSIVAHESRCHYYTIAWNLPGKPETAKSKFFDSLEDAKILAEKLIAEGKYRVDVGIGQINNEAHLQPKGWSLEEVLNPLTALNRVAKVLKERSWAKYHSNNPILAKKWQDLALASLNDVLGAENSPRSVAFKKQKALKTRNTGSLIVFNALTPI